MTTQSTENKDTMGHVPFMNTLTACINTAIKGGYTDNLKVTKQGLYVEALDKTYAPAEVMIKDFYRFEGQSDPADNAILYVIETQDGVKGTLVDAYGTYADEYINKFMTSVEEISKKEMKK